MTAPIFLPPYHSGTGTPEDEEELALLQRLEKMPIQPQHESVGRMPALDHGPALPHRRSVGQLGVRTTPQIKTVTLYDGKDPRKKTPEDRDMMEAAGLEQVERTYASNGDWAIDIRDQTGGTG